MEFNLLNLLRRYKITFGGMDEEDNLGAKLC
jgi:hypothetical protein